MANKQISLMHQKILEGTIAGFAVAAERARQTGTPLILWRDGKVVEVSPDDPSIQSPKQGDNKR